MILFKGNTEKILLTPNRMREWNRGENPQILIFVEGETRQQ